MQAILHYKREEDNIHHTIRHDQNKRVQVLHLVTRLTFVHFRAGFQKRLKHGKTLKSESHELQVLLSESYLAQTVKNSVEEHQELSSRGLGNVVQSFACIVANATVLVTEAGKHGWDQLREVVIDVLKVGRETQNTKSSQCRQQQYQAHGPGHSTTGMSLKLSSSGSTSV